MDKTVHIVDRIEDRKKVIDKKILIAIDVVTLPHKLSNWPVQLLYISHVTSRWQLYPTCVMQRYINKWTIRKIPYTNNFSIIRSQGKCIFNFH